MKGLLRKILVMWIVALFLGATGLAFFKANMLAYASGTIYIRANGLVEGTDKIANENNVTYTFADDINDSVVVERSNIIIDGDGYALNGSSSLMIGLNLTSVSNVTIKNTNIEGFLSYSIYLESASECVISDNTVIGSEGGIGLLSSTGNMVSGNMVTGCSEAVDLFSASANVVSGNNLSDSSTGVHAFINCTGNTVYGNRMIGNNLGVLLSSSSNFNTVIGNNVTPNSHDGIHNGILIESSSSNSVSGNGITNSSGYGIWLRSSANNNTLSGNNIVSSGNSGIYLDASSNNVISGNIVRDSPNEHIELLYSSNNNTISGNTLTNSTADVGIYVYGCSLNSFFGNNITLNANSGIRIDSSSDITIVENSISENLNGIYLWYSSSIAVSGNVITANDADGIVLDNSNANQLGNNNITNNLGNEITLVYSSNNIVSGNDIEGGGYGVYLVLANLNTISGNIIMYNEGNVYIGNSSENMIFGNTITSGAEAFQLGAAFNNTISDNIMRDNTNGVWLRFNSTENVISGNNITDNSNGVYIESGSNNKFYHNNFINNTNQVQSSGDMNLWDDNYPSGGNYWSDYNGTDQYEGISQDIPGNDTIGDAPYEINVNNIDRYPLMTQYEPLIPLFLESKGRWDMGIDTDIQVWSVYASDVDGDGVVEILTCGQVNESAELRIYSYDGLTITLEHTEMWNSTEGDTRAWSVFAADVDGDGVTEILTGAETYNGQDNVYYDGQLRIWNWNGTILTLEHSEEWHTGNNTHVYSVFAYDVDGDGEVEIMTGGDAYDAGNNYICELRVWNWNGTALTLEASEVWGAGGGEAVWSVYAADVDGDGIVEILTAGEYNFNAQLRIWNCNGTALTLEHSEEWTLSWTARAISVFASDIDGDGNIEIVTGGEASAHFDSSWVDNGQLRVWNWNGSALTLKDSREWPLNGTYTYAWTICSGDVDRDGLPEIITAGASGNGAQLRVWSFNNSTLTLDASQESVDEWADTVFASDVDNDGTTEIITAGYTYNATSYYEQLKIWSLPESIPPTITIISPENKTYSTNTIPLTFAIDEPAEWIGYSLNGQANVTITGNTTLPTLPDGWYNVAVFANDTYGNMGMSVVYFTVDTANPDIASVVQDPLTNVLPDTVVKINATVTDATSGVKQVTLNYTTGDGTWTSVAMMNLEGEIWNATIPAFPYGTNVTYMIIAEDNAGNTITSVEQEYELGYQVVPELSLWAIIAAFMTTTLLMAVIFKKKNFRRA
jgi:parallel beta-helix repeat protein